MWAVAFSQRVLDKRGRTQERCCFLGRNYGVFLRAFKPGAIGEHKAGGVLLFLFSCSHHSCLAFFFFFSCSNVPLSCLLDTTHTHTTTMIAPVLHVCARGATFFGGGGRGSVFLLTLSSLFGLNSLIARARAYAMRGVFFLDICLARFFPIFCLV